MPLSTDGEPTNGLSALKDHFWLPDIVSKASISLLRNGANKVSFATAKVPCTGPVCSISHKVSPVSASMANTVDSPPIYTVPFDITGADRVAGPM